MRKAIAYLILAILSLYTTLQAQEIKQCSASGATNCGVLNVSNRETVHLVFPSKIRYVDLGSSFFVFKLDSNTNLLKIKAKKWDTQEITNLTVVTDDNFLYSFQVRVATPTVFTYVMAESNVKIPESKQFTNHCYIALNNQANKAIFKKKYKGVSFSLTGSYYLNGKFLLTFEIINKTRIPFEIESISINITRKKSAFRQKVAYQDVVLYADETKKCNYQSTIMPGKRNTFTLSYDKFYPPKGYFVRVKLNEKMENFGRNIKKRVSFNKLAQLQ